MKSMEQIKSKQISLGGVLAALAVVILLLGGLIPVGTYLCPMLASIPFVILLAELPKPLCVGWYAVVAILGVLLCPDRETAFVFVFLGWYPIAKPTLDRLPRWVRVPVKLVIFLAAVSALYALLILVFQLEALVAEAKETGFPMLIALLVLGCAAFLLFDLLLSRLTILYQIKRKK